jgi:hypothetical protein
MLDAVLQAIGPHGVGTPRFTLTRHSAVAFEELMYAPDFESVMDENGS